MASKSSFYLFQTTLEVAVFMAVVRTLYPRATPFSNPVNPGSSAFAACRIVMGGGRCATVIAYAGHKGISIVGQCMTEDELAQLEAAFSNA